VPHSLSPATATSTISATARQSRPSLLRTSASADQSTASPKGNERPTISRPAKTLNVNSISQALNESATELQSPLAAKLRPSALLNKTEHSATQPRSSASASVGLNRSVHGAPTYNRDTNRPALRAPAGNTKPSAKDETILLGASLHRLNSRTQSAQTRRALRQQSTASHRSRAVVAVRDDTSVVSADTSVATGTLRAAADDASYFEKLCWVCEHLNYPYEYADIVGSQFLGLDSASPVTHVNGHVPTMSELVEFLALAFICLVESADLTVILLDDFQWVDSFSWKIFRTLCSKGKKLLVMCATRSHDKQALRRLSAAASGQDQMVSQMIEVSLGPLDFNEIRELIAKVLGYEEWTVGDTVCSDIFQRTGGLPVYVVQVLDNIKRKKTLELDARGMIQWTVEGLIEHVSCGFRALEASQYTVQFRSAAVVRFAEICGIEQDWSDDGRNLPFAL
jgi:hypothetical protein